MSFWTRLNIERRINEVTLRSLYGIESPKALLD